MAGATPLHCKQFDCTESLEECWKAMQEPNGVFGFQESHPMAGSDLLVEIAYFTGGKVDFYSTQFFGFICKDLELAQKWRKGLHALISQNGFNSNRYAPPISLMNHVYTRYDLSTAFDTLFEGRNYIGRDILLQFLGEIQRDPRLNEVLDPMPTLADCDEIINRFEEDEKLRSTLIPPPRSIP
ncbi:uncharacterized protein MONBRDRAFT_5883 [Monosiga brevicollis MX1]|uniref:Uncharacterized protein n=1 Tax=Monosiga brevicollis TaxID=81824 RepID=A9USS0_MONBE|nr:uncharacterized protein MONBRDRAFT_5883 [Monosiga brevicollis MX1]EDQ91826.1 predicted protein [Monosiga brevicollis MX1]|eukprot:XP_001743112.1 hypothetical protein [Monosiga brevicollis MX1]